MTRQLDASSLDLKTVIRPGDHIVWSQGTGEPLTLTEALVSQRQELGGVSVFISACFSRTLQPEHTDAITVNSFGAMGTASRLARAGAIEIVPCHFGQIAKYIADGAIGCNVAFVQVSPPGPDGTYSYGVTFDYISTAVSVASVVVAEVNDQVPWTYGGQSLTDQDIDYLVHTSRPVLEVGAAAVGETERTIASHAAGFIGDGTVLQIGIGAIPDAIAQTLTDRRDLGIHSGMVGDSLVDLVECGAVTNARKPIDTGVSVSGALIGTRRLYDFAHQNASLVLRETGYTHSAAVLGQLDGLVSINSAVEVDLTGQANAEVAAGAYLGATGGQVDFVRAGHRSAGGRSIIAFASTAKNDEISRICMRLGGPVTTARSEADLIITEYGVADLRAQPLRERARRMIAIAHPRFRESLEREAQDLFKRGY